MTRRAPQMIHTVKQWLFYLVISACPSLLMAQQRLSPPQAGKDLHTGTEPQTNIRYDPELKIQDSVYLSFYEALIQSENGVSPFDMRKTLETAGKYYAGKGSYDHGLALHQKALQLCINSPGMYKALPAIFNGMGNIYSDLAKYELAAKCYYQALLVAEHLSIKEIEGVYSNLSTILIPLKRYEDALYYLDKAEARAKQNHNPEILAYALIHKGNVYLHMNEIEKSRFYYQSALNIGNQYNIPSAQYTAFGSMANVYLEAGNAKQALPYLLGIEKIKHMLSPVHKVATYQNLAETYYRIHNYDLAEHYILQAIKTADSFHLGENHLMSHEILADIYVAKKQFDKSTQELKTYIKLEDSFHNQEIARNINQLSIKYRTAEKDRELLQKQLLISRQENYLRTKNLWIFGISVTTLFIALISIGLHRISKHKQNAQANQIDILHQEKKREQFEAMVQGEEKERNRLGYALHDGIGGMLTAINMNLSAIQQRHKHIPEMKDLDILRQMLSDTTIEVRKTAHNLMPDKLLKYTMPEMLQWYCDQISSGSDLDIQLHFYGSLDEMDANLWLPLYRILQELIQNIVKHAQATEAEVQVHQHEDMVRITVEDNGKGFDTGKEYEGLGLQSIRSRVASMQGHVSIESAEGRGTIICIELG